MPCPHNHSDGASCPTLRPTLPPLPQRMKNLPLDHRGFPVPWFVDFIDGVPDFRVMDGDKFIKAIKFGKCWVCGGPMGSYKAFVAGPMCGINRTSAEPPSHLECAEFSAMGCPFLARPKMRRNEVNMPDHAVKPAGEMIMRNPGVAMLWVTKSYRPFQAGKTGTDILINIGEPEYVRWYAEGREATRAEVDESIRTGIGRLAEIAKMEKGGIEHLHKCIEKFVPYLPPGEGAEITSFIA